RRHRADFLAGAPGGSGKADPLPPGAIGRLVAPADASGRARFAARAPTRSPRTRAPHSIARAPRAAGRHGCIDGTGRLATRRRELVAGARGPRRGAEFLSRAAGARLFARMAKADVALTRRSRPAIPVRTDGVT